MATMSPERKEVQRKLMKERWADPQHRAVLIRQLRAARQAKLKAGKVEKSPRSIRRRKAKVPPWVKQGISRQQWNGRRTMKMIRDAERYRETKNHKSTTINVGDLRDRWSGLITTELHQQIQKLIGDAATLAGIKPVELSKRLIKLLQK